MKLEHDRHLRSPNGFSLFTGTLSPIVVCSLQHGHQNSTVAGAAGNVLMVLHAESKSSAAWVEATAADRRPRPRAFPAYTITADDGEAFAITAFERG